MKHCSTSRFSSVFDLHLSAGRDRFERPILPVFAHELFACRDHFSAVPNVLVWTAAYDPMGDFAYRHMTAHGYGVHPVTGLCHQILRVVFIVGHVIFYVRLADSKDGQGLGWRDPRTEFALLLDVVSGQSAAWRTQPLGDSGISDTFNRHIHGGIYPGQDDDVWRGLD
jgi:hypothetical protein